MPMRLEVASAWLVAGLLAAPSPPLQAANQGLSADAIMARVARNQDRSQALRKQYVYGQNIHIVSHKHNGRLLREETADSDVAPTAEGTDKTLTQLKGRYLAKGKYESFRGDHPRIASMAV